MIQKEVQLVLTEKIKGDSIIQLKDGKLIFYYYREDYNIYIYHEKTFQLLFEINLKYLIYKFGRDIEKNNNKLENKEIEKENFLLLFENKYDETRNKNSIKELDNGLILIARNKYLIELNLHKKNYDYKLAKQLDDDILEINELPDKRIMVITTQNIVLYERKNEEYIFKEEYRLKNNWKFSAEGLLRDINQYFFSYVLPNNRLLLNSFFIEFKDVDGCVIGKKVEFSNSKIIFIDLKNFEEILSTEAFDKDAKYIVLDNEIVIQSYESLIIYDINSLKPIKVIKNDKEFKYLYLYKFDKNQLIAYSVNIERNGDSVLIYKIEDKDLIKHYEIRAKSYDKIFGWDNNKMIGSDNFIFLLRDKRIIIRLYGYIFLFEIIKN